MAQTLSVDEVLQHIRKAVLFIEGITVSGGEATTQLPFIVALFNAIKTDPQLQHLTCMVDSNGILSETGWQKLLPVCDGVMLDLKAWDSACHRQLTGRDNTLIKQSITFCPGRENLRNCACWLFLATWIIYSISMHWRRLSNVQVMYRCG